MADLILLYPTYRMGFGEEIDLRTPATYNIRYVRVSSNQVEAAILAGQAEPQLPAGSVILSGEVCATDGTPPHLGSLGSPAVGSLDDALGVVRDALSNPYSVLRKKEFGPDTPVYIWRPGRKALRTISPSGE
jgi:hypothetical protein